MKSSSIIWLFILVAIPIGGAAQSSFAANVLFPDFIPWHSNDVSPLAALLHAALKMELEGSRAVALIEVSDVKDDSLENDHSDMIIMNDNTALELARRVDAAKILIGEYESSDGSNFIVRCTLMDVKTGIVDRQWIDENISKDDYEDFCFKVARQTVSSIQQSIVLSNLRKINQINPRFGLRCTCDKREYRLGETLSLKLRATRNCYVVVFDIGTDGKATLLFPQNQEGGKKLIAGTDLNIGDVLASPPPGTELIKTIATLDSLTISRLQELLTEKLIPEIGDSQDRRLMLGNTPLADERWATHELRLNIRE